MVLWGGGQCFEEGLYLVFAVVLGAAVDSHNLVIPLSKPHPPIATISPLLDPPTTSIPNSLIPPFEFPC